MNDDIYWRKPAMKHHTNFFLNEMALYEQDRSKRRQRKVEGQHK